MQILRKLINLCAREEEAESLPLTGAGGTVHQLLLARWTREKTQPLPPEDSVRVQQVFRALGSEATPDVLALYGSVGGMRAPDDVGWRLWPLEEVMMQPVSEHGVVFSDYICSCWDYRLRPVSARQSAVYVDYHNGNPAVLAARSLEEFLKRYLADADALMTPRPTSVQPS